MGSKSSAEPENFPSDSTRTDIMSRLFDFDLDLVLQMIFVSLDPRSLHTSKRVCKQWHKFIKSRIWKSKSMLKILHSKLEWQWKNGLPSVKTIKVKAPVFDVRSDSDIIVAGLRNGSALVFDKRSGSVIFCLNHEEDRHHHGQDVIQVDFSDTLIVSVSSVGSVMVWRRQDGTLIQRMTHHCDHPVWGVSVVGNTVLTCGEDHSLAILQYSPEIDGVKLLHQLYDHHTSVSHVDSDETWALTGTATGEMKLWDIKEAKCIRTIPSQRIHSLTLKYPLAATVGAADNLGVHVWDVQNGKLIRSLLQTCAMEDVRIFGSHLVSATSAEEIFYRRDAVDCRVIIWDLEEVTDTSIAENDLWYRDFYCRETNAFGISVDETCLIYSELDNEHNEHRSTITLRDFWLCDRPVIGWEKNFLDSIQV